MKRGIVAVTGAGGFIGRNLISMLLERGYTVHAMDLPGANPWKGDRWGGRVRPFDIDIRKGETLTAPLEGVETLFHTAAIFDLGAPSSVVMDTNVNGSILIVEAALKKGVGLLIHFSSTGVYGVPSKIPCAEGDLKRPRNPYEKSKWESEEAVVSLCNKGGLPFLILRPTLVYGEWSRYGHARFIALSTLLVRKRIREGKPVRGFRGGRSGHHVHVRDVVNSAIHLAAREDFYGSTINIADLKPYSLGDLLNTFVKGHGLEPQTYIELDSFLAKSLSRIAPLIPGLLNRMREKAGKAWERLVEAGEVKPFLDPRIGGEWIDYVKGDFVYDIERLRSSEYEFLYPDISTGIPEVMRWYREMGFIPAIGIGE